MQASIASIVATSEIVSATILAYIFLNERLEIWQFLGAIFIIAGVILVSLTNGRKKENLT